MPQVANNNVQALKVLQNRALQVQAPTTTARNISAATVVKSGPGLVTAINVITGAGSGTVNLYDASSTAGGNQVVANQLSATITATAAGNNPLNSGIPFTSGLLVVPSAGVVVAVSYS